MPNLRRATEKKDRFSHQLLGDRRPHGVEPKTFAKAPPVERPVDDAFGHLADRHAGVNGDYSAPLECGADDVVIGAGCGNIDCPTCEVGPNDDEGCQ